VGIPEGGILYGGGKKKGGEKGLGAKLNGRNYQGGTWGKAMKRKERRQKIFERVSISSKE